MCRGRGFSAVQSVLRAVPSNSLRTYIIWVPALTADTRQDAVEASAEFTDACVNYFWDPEMTVANPFGKTLGLTRFAWDVYLLYDQGEKWKKDSPSKPNFWMHQLGGADELASTLDSVVLRWQTETLIPKRGL